MGLIIPSAAAYARMCKQLLPAGKWRLDADSNLSKLFLAVGDEFTRVSGRLSDLIEESDPRTATELLEDFERVLDLSSDGTDDERRGRIAGLLARRQRCRPVDFQNALATILGLAAEDVGVIERDRAFAILVEDDREIYRFFIYRDPFAAGSYSIEDAQDIIDRMSQSHTKGHAIETVDFRCDDAMSLCDRDILEYQHFRCDDSHSLCDTASDVLEQYPVAVASQEVAVIAGTRITCNASGSTFAFKYEWTCTSHPYIDIADSEYATFVSPPVASGFIFVTTKLVVTDVTGATSEDTATTVVLA